MKNNLVDELKRRLVEIAHLNTASSLLHWDREVNMAPRSIDSRAATTAYLAGLIHNKFIAVDSDGLLKKLKKQLDSNKLKGGDAVIVGETWRSFERERKLPEKFVRKMAEVTSKAQHIWAEARKQNKFSLFKPWLSEIVKLKREEARLVGYSGSPYDALLDVYEPGMTTGNVSEILFGLKDFLVPFIRKIKSSQRAINANIARGSFPLDKQHAFNESIARKIGFDFETGRVDKSAHPFTITMHPQDVRFTTRYRNNDVLYSIGSTIHETGHALYEQGLPAEHFGTPLAESISLGVHESQSRMWENMIGKSKSFWKYFYPKLQKEFPVPFMRISLNDFYNIVNFVKPSLIRTESDEVTYNLHIIIRFELEKAIIEGSLEIKDLPAAWRSKVNEYLGLDVPSDTLGVLQDVHWSGGSIGYFPTYTLGNMYAAQFYSAMSKKIHGLSNKIAKGDFRDIKKWLNKNIHQHGKTYKPNDLLVKVTGEPLNSRYFCDYLENKYKAIYKF